MRPAFSGPIPLRDLTYGEHLLVWTYRTTLRGEACPLVRHEFKYACGEAAGVAFAAMGDFVRQLRAQASRSILAPAPGRLNINDDEIALLTAFAAIQRGDQALFLVQLRRMAGGPVQPALLAPARTVAQTLLAGGHAIRADFTSDGALRRAS